MGTVSFLVNETVETAAQNDSLKCFKTRQNKRFYTAIHPKIALFRH